MSVTTADIHIPPASELAMATKVLAFASMSIGFFIALLDIQIVSASLADIGGGLSAGADEIAWVQTSYLIAEIVVIPLSGWLYASVLHTLAILCIRRRFHRDQPVMRLGVEYRKHDRVPCAARLPRWINDPHRLHHRLLLLQWPAACDRRGHHRLHFVIGANIGPDDRRLDH